MEQLDEPTQSQTYMAIVPPLMVFSSSLFMLWFAYIVKGSSESKSPIVSTILSIEMLLMCMLILFYRHHERYDMVPFIYRIIIRINLLHLIVCSCFISYVKMSGDNYSTYFTWLYILTIPIMILSISPFFIIHSL